MYNLGKERQSVHKKINYTSYKRKEDMIAGKHMQADQLRRQVQVAGEISE